MSNLFEEVVLSVSHWTEHLFSFTTTRNQAFRFSNGHFVMIGLPAEGKPLLRAYSLASPNYEEHLEFLSIKVPDGPLTSRLQKLQVGDTVLVGKKPTGTLVTDYLLPGKRLFMLSTGTGLAPFLSIIRDPETYERFEDVVLVHGVRRVQDLAYREYITQELPAHELLGDIVKQKLHYVPAVTREPFERQGRITALINSGRLCSDLTFPQLNPTDDRVMICGGPEMLGELRALMQSLRFSEGTTSRPGQFVVERAFVEQ